MNINHYILTERNTLLFEDGTELTVIDGPWVFQDQESDAPAPKPHNPNPKYRWLFAQPK